MTDQSPDLAFLVRINKEEYERIYDNQKGTSVITGYGFTDTEMLGRTEDGDILHNAYVKIGDGYFRMVEPMTVSVFVQMRLDFLVPKPKVAETIPFRKKPVVQKSAPRKQVIRKRRA